MKKLIDKKSVIYLIIVLLISMVLNIIAIKYCYQNYDDNLNRILNGIITEVISKYPEVDEEDIIALLNNKTDGSILQKYNIDSYTIIQNEKNLKTNITIIILINILTIVLTFIIYVIYVYKENKKINKITEYIKRINNHDYSLAIETNDTEELSILQNELYKITIMLKEQALNSLNDKEVLKKAVSDISHQIKTPLTSIAIMIDNILDNPNMEEKIKNDFLRDIRKQIENINFLVITLLKASRFDADVVVMKRDVIDSKTLINKVLSNLNILIELKNINTITDIEEAKFIGDFKWEEEALTNIIKNSIEHSDEGGTIKISCYKCPFYTKITIQDEGEGIEKQELKNIFKRFYKGSKASSDSFGIGLNLAKTIIEKDGGYINVTSKLKKGTTFEIKYMQR